MWLWIYQSLPGTDDDHVRKGIEKYIDKQAIPILKKHRSKLEKIPVDIIKELNKDVRIRRAVKETIIQFFVGEVIKPYPLFEYMKAQNTVYTYTQY